jgi:hypothetical protein
VSYMDRGRWGIFHLLCGHKPHLTSYKIPTNLRTFTTRIAYSLAGRAHISRMISGIFATSTRNTVYYGNKKTLKFIPARGGASVEA